MPLRHKPGLVLNNDGYTVTQYSTGAWRTFAHDGIELMPGTYTFKSPSQSKSVAAAGTTFLD